MQDSILFYPEESTFPLHVEYEEYELPVAGSGEISSRGYIINAESDGPVVVFFTGNLGEARTYVERFSSFGVPVVINNYRGFGKSDGNPRERTMVGDAKRLIKQVRSSFPDRPLVLMGNSMGSAVAILACDDGIEGLILAAPYRSLVHVGRKTPGRFFPLRLLMRTKLDVRSKLSSLPEKILVLYSEDDTLIPTEETLRVLEKLPQAQVAVAQGHHNNLLWHQHILDATKTWLETHFAASMGGE